MLDLVERTEPRPYTLIAELTYRCPLRCPYCSNPTDLAAHDGELDTETWCRVLEEAESLGVMQVHFTGGEPLARKDLEVLSKRARELGLYTNLVTSGIPLTKERLAAIHVDHVQVSVQAADPKLADTIAGYEGHPRKLDVMRWVKELDLPLTINVVLHRANLHEIDRLVALAEEMKADRLELANTQYLAWALMNRETLLPTRAQLEAAGARAAFHKKRLAGVMDILFVKPDYFGTTPKACMDGWARRFIHMTPAGLVLPCHAATTIKTLTFDNVRDRSLREIWLHSPALNAYRGDSWMQEPCRSCDGREKDFGGCRCQAFALAGDAAATDPACSLSPVHALVTEAQSEERRYLHRGR